MCSIFDSNVDFDWTLLHFHRKVPSVFLLSNKQCWRTEMLPASLAIMPTTLTTWLGTVVIVCGVLLLLLLFFQTVQFLVGSSQP